MMKLKMRSTSMVRGFFRTPRTSLMLIKSHHAIIDSVFKILCYGESFKGEYHIYNGYNYNNVKEQRKIYHVDVVI